MMFSMHIAGTRCISRQRPYITSNWKGVTLQLSCYFHSTPLRKDIASKSLPSSLPSSSSSSSPPLYKVAKISKDGQVKYKSLSISEILSGSSMYARDLFSLNLTSTQYFDHMNKDEERLSRSKALRSVRPSAAILPREEDIIISFGTMRALIGPNSGMIFDAHKPTVQLLAEDLSETIQKINRCKNNRKRRKQGWQGHSDNNDDSDDEEEPFELVFMEEVLRDVSDTYTRRLKLYEPIVNSILTRVNNEMFAAEGIHRLVPVKDSIQEFELRVQSALDCLKDLLENDEDMVALLLSKKKKARDNGYNKLDPNDHGDVELLIEEYARRLNTILHETKYLLKKVESKQEIIAISLDAYRNRMIRMNVYLSITGIGIATSTAVAGFLGMNLVNGFEESQTAFSVVVFGTSAFGMMIGAGCISYISGSSMRRRSMEGLEEITLLDGALSHLSSIDYAIKYMVSKKQSMDKSEFSKRILESQPSNRIHENETDLLFNAFDVSKDGMLGETDLQSFAHLELQSKHHFSVDSSDETELKKD